MKSRYYRCMRISQLPGLLLLLSLPLYLQAQMRVGAPTGRQPLNPGASLEVQSGPYADSTYRGLLLPRVALINYATWSLAGEPTNGMEVYNTATTTGNFRVTPGVYVWSNFQWNQFITAVNPAIIATLDCAPDLSPAGQYITSFPLTEANTKSVRITPASAGTFTARTNSVNGYSFSGSGSFSAAQVGIPQTVVLQGSGVPQTGGTTSFSLTVETQACSFTVNTQTYLDCSGPLTGVYKADQPLDASNTKQVTIVPRSAGEYYFFSILYNPDNKSSYSFTKRITFTAEQVGVSQTVLLEANGTPKMAGTLNARLEVYVNQAYVTGCLFPITIAP